jgi:hypothetical protein
MTTRQARAVTQAAASTPGTITTRRLFQSQRKR